MRSDNFRIISGGQTGVDRAALDAAVAASIPCGGWCPAGRRAEDGPIDERYPLTETASRNFAVRTRWNVRDSDGTLILSGLPLTGGTLLTEREAARRGKPRLIVDLYCGGGAAPGVERAAGWVSANDIGTLNIAGPRESSRPGIGGLAADFLTALFDALTR